MYRNYGSGTTTTTSTVLITTRDDERLPLIVRTIERVYSRPTLFGMCRTNFLFGVYLVTYLMFLGSGAAVFSLLETPEDHALRVRLNTAIRNFRVANPTVSGQ